MSIRERIRGFLGKQQAAAAEPVQDAAWDEEGENNPFLARPDLVKSIVPDESTRSSKSKPVAVPYIGLGS